MTHLDPLSRTNPAPQLPDQSAKSSQAGPRRVIDTLRRLSLYASYNLYNQIPLTERVTAIQTTQLPLDLKMKLFQLHIKQKLKETETDSALLCIFKEIKILCSPKIEGQENDIYDSQLFDNYFQPIIQEVSRYKGASPLSFKVFHTKRETFSEDTAFSEMMGHWYICEIHSQKKLTYALKRENHISKIKVIYEMGTEGLRILSDSLKSNGTVTHLNLLYNGLTDADAKTLAESLKDNCKLTLLYLADNHIGDEGATAFAETLKMNKTLKSLTFSKNQIGDKGAKAIADALKDNKTLTQLNLRANQIGNAGAKAVAAALEINRTFLGIDI